MASSECLRNPYGNDIVPNISEDYGHLRCTRQPSSTNIIRNPFRRTLKPSLKSVRRTRARPQSSSHIAKSTDLGTSGTWERLTMVPPSYFSGYVTARTDLVRLVPFRTHLESFRGYISRRKNTGSDCSYRRPYSSLGLGSQLRESSSIPDACSPTTKSRSKFCRSHSRCLQSGQCSRLHEHPAVRYSDYFKVPLSGAPAKWNSIGEFYEQWKSVDDGSCDRPMSLRLSRQMMLNYPLSMEHEFHQELVECRAKESLSQPQFCRSEKMKFDYSKSTPLSCDSVKDGRTDSVLVELRNSAASPLSSWINSNASVSLIKPQKAITPSIVKIQSNFCLAVEDVSESAKRYAASLTCSEIRDKIVLWRLSTPRISRGMRAIMPKAIVSHPQEKCLEGIPLPYPLFQSASIEEILG